MKGFSHDDRRQRVLPWVITGLLVLLAVVLATFQYRWLNQVAEADRARTRTALDTAVQRVAQDFNGELLKLVSAVRGGRLSHRGEDVSASLVEALERWRESRLGPELVRAAWVFEEDGTRRLDEASVTLLEATPSPELESLRESMDEVWQDPRSAFRRSVSRRGPRFRLEHGELRHGPFPDLLSAEVPAIVLPLLGAGDPEVSDRERVSRDASPVERSSKDRTPRRTSRDRARPDAERERERESFDSVDRRRSRRGAPARLVGFLVLELDRQALIEGLLTELAELHFGDGLPFRLTVRPLDETRGKSPVGPGAGLDSGPESEPLFVWQGGRRAGVDRDRQGSRTRESRVEAEAELFGPLLKLRGEPSRRWRLFPHWEMDGHPATHGRWLLTASHPAGSLDRALEQARRRNLAVALGILLVLTGALLLLTRNGLRARALARRQLDFVAGVTHELMTPVAALRSAGQNLADGVVTDPAQVARYGRMIDREGGRLGDLVGQVLAFARMQTEKPRFHPQVLRPEDLIQAAREDVEARLEAEGIELQVSIEDGLPAVWSDRQAALRSLVNLLGNAVKYGRPAEGEHWIGLRCTRSGSQVEFLVEDRGPGIPTGDRGQIFEPFFRGSDHAAGAVPGSGLGLALVKHWIEAQGGRVTLRSKPGQGAKFTIGLPIHRPDQTPEGDEP